MDDRVAKLEEKQWPGYARKRQGKVEGEVRRAVSGVKLEKNAVHVHEALRKIPAQSGAKGGHKSQRGI